MAHNTTYEVLDALPPRQKFFWEIEGLSREELDAFLLKGNPDLYCGAKGKEKKEMSKYMSAFSYPTDRKTRYGINNNGRIFHYFPVDTDIYEGSGSWQSDSTEKWRFVDKGFREYLTKILKWLAAGKKHDALTATAGLFHVLQDQCAFFHSLEGEEGCSQWILDELIERPADCLMTPTSLLSEQSPATDLCGYKPVLLGTGIEEISFQLYHKYRALKSANRRLLVPMVQAYYKKDKAGEDEIRCRIVQAVAELTYDLIYTIYCAATSDFKKLELKSLQCVYLSDVKPINYPRHSAPPYRMNTLVKNCSLGAGPRKYPLSLLISTKRGCRERRFSRGIGMGSHRESVITYAIPEKVFKRFHGYFGMHSKLGKDGNVEFEVRFDGKRKIKENLSRDNPVIEINLDVMRGGLLQFFIRAREGVRGVRNNLVLADPCLTKFQ